MGGTGPSESCRILINFLSNLVMTRGAGQGPATTIGFESHALRVTSAKHEEGVGPQRGARGVDNPRARKGGHQTLGDRLVPEPSQRLPQFR